jgi:P-type Cu2+ transporter
VIYLSKNGRLHGHLILCDDIRPGASDVINALKASGKAVYLCTGADANLAVSYADLFGVARENVFSDCETTGERSKLAHLESLKREGYHVAMIGDSVNDASVIAKSDFGLVVQHDAGHEGAQQGASAILRKESLVPLLQLFKIAQKTTSNINQNVGFSFIYNAVAMLAPAALLLGAGLALNPAVGTALMMLQTLLIFANVYRFSVEVDPSVENESETPVAQTSAHAGIALNGLTLSHRMLIPEHGPNFIVDPDLEESRAGIFP